MFFNYKIDIKDDKFRITIFDPYWYIDYSNVLGGINKFYPVGKNFFINFAISIDRNKILENIKNYIENGTIQDEEW